MQAASENSHAIKVLVCASFGLKMDTSQVSKINFLYSTLKAFFSKIFLHHYFYCSVAWKQINSVD